MEIALYYEQKTDKIKFIWTKMRNICYICMASLSVSIHDTYICAVYTRAMYIHITAYNAQRWCNMWILSSNGNGKLWMVLNMPVVRTQRPLASTSFVWSHGCSFCLFFVVAYLSVEFLLLFSTLFFVFGRDKKIFFLDII